MQIRARIKMFAVNSPWHKNTDLVVLSKSFTFKRISGILLGVLFYFCLTILNVIFKLRIGVLNSSRIGHFAANTELFLRRKYIQNEKKNEIQVFITDGKVANNQLLTMIKRKLHVIDNSFIIKIIKTSHMIFKSSSLWIEMPFRNNEYYEFSNICPQLSFTEEEEREGKALLAKMEVSPEAPFVCFHARDGLYLNKTLKGYDWSYHDYRDCKIENYLKAVEYLSSQKIFALRIGYIVSEKISTNNPFIIDYANNFRSELGDVYLLAKCKFILACTAGIRLISSIFNIPIAAANIIPIGDLSLGKQDLVIFKKHWTKEKKRFLTFREIISMKAEWWLTGEKFKKAGIEMIENSPEEIFALSREMNERLDGTWVNSEEDEYLQQRFKNLFPPEHLCFGFTSRVGTHFLRENKELLN